MTPHAGAGLYVHRLPAVCPPVMHAGSEFDLQYPIDAHPAPPPTLAVVHCCALAPNVTTYVAHVFTRSQYVAVALGADPVYTPGPTMTLSGQPMRLKSCIRS